MIDKVDIYASEIAMSSEETLSMLLNLKTKLLKDQDTMQSASE